MVRNSNPIPFGGNNGLVLSWPNNNGSGSAEASNSQQERGGQSEHQSGEVKK